MQADLHPRFYFDLASPEAYLVAERVLHDLPELAEWQLELRDSGNELLYVFDGTAERTGIPSLLGRMRDLGIAFRDLNTRQSSLEDIFVGLLRKRA